MQRFRKTLLVVSLTAAFILGPAAAGAPKRHHRAAAADGDIVSVILDLIQLASRISLPPG